MAPYISQKAWLSNRYFAGEVWDGINKINKIEQQAEF
jgi:hypothetical protein